MIQVVKTNGTTYGGANIYIIDKYGKPKTPFVPIVWGTITGTLSAQTDLQDALNLKEDKINKGLPNGYASLNGAGLVPSSQLPSYVDDIVEVANYAALPIPGETGKIYVTLDTNEVYRWSGSVYIEIAANPAVWGTITGTVTAQTDLTSYLSSNYYPLVTNPAGYITSAALAPYLTSATAASTYYPLTNPNGYISGITSGMVTTALGFTPYDAANPAGYITSSALTPYLLSSTAASTYYPLTNPAGYITASALTPYLTTASAALTYYPIPTGTTSQYIRGDGSVASFPTIPSVTPSALTKTDDTNVTLTLGGSPSTALLAATSITVGWTGTLADSRIASASTWNAKQDALSGTGFVKSTAGVISYDTNTYLTTADAASTYYPLTNPAGYITASSLTGYVPYTGATADLNLGTYNLKVGNGTVSNNSIQIGAANVGLYSPSANRIDFVTNGIARMAIISNGNVVMGNTTTSVIGNSYLDYVTNQTGLKLSGTALNLAVTGSNLLNIFGVTTTGNTTSFSLTKPNNTGQTATFSISGWNYNGGSRQWLTGNIGTQSENVWGSVTYDFVGASVVDTAYGNVFNAATAGTNATISNNYAGHFIGNIFMSGGNRIIKSSNALILEGASGSPTTLRAGGGGSINLAFLNEVSYLTIYGYQSTGALSTFNFTKPNNIGQTASTAIPGWTYAGGSRTWLAGNIAAQNENVWGAVTYNFGGASVIAKAIGNVFNAPIAGTNTTITANFAAQFNGNVEMVGAMTALYYMSVSNPNAVATASAKFQVTNAAGNTAQFSIASNSDAVDPSLLSIGGSNKGVEFSSNSVRALKILDGSRNVTIQNGGTVTDNGYRLEVFGTTSVVGTTSTDSTTLSAEQLTTGTGTNWTGTSYTTGYTHTVGSVVPLVSAFIPSANTYYQIVFTLSGRTAGSVNIAFSLYSSNGLNTNGTTTIGIRSLSTVTPAFTLTPTTDFDGTIVASIKFISAIMAPLATYKTSTSVVNTEIRSGVTTQNTYVGANVGRYNTTGLQNVGLGFNAMPNNMTGNSNTVLGYVAGVSLVNGSNNTYVGSGAGYFGVSSQSNTCIGASAGYNTTGSSNIFIGVSTGNGSNGPNTGIGNNVLTGLTTGANNNGIGFAALQLLTTASYNDALGREAGANNTTGSGNQFFGFRAGRYIADGTTSNAITENSIYIGYQTKALANNQTNQIVIGYNTTGIGSNTTVLGNSSTVTTAIYGNLMLGTTTASTYKLDVQGTANILTSLNLGNYATPTAQRIFTIGQDTSYTTIGSLVGATSNAAMYMNTATPTVNNYVFRSDGANVWVNSPSAGASIILTTGSAATPLRMYGNLNTASVASYVWTKPTYLNGTASTPIPGWSYDGTTRQWLTGNITTQSENVWGAVTYSFVGASTITTAFGNVFNPAIAGTNCTITNNFAGQFNGQVQINGAISNNGGLPNIGSAATPYGTFFITNIRGATDLSLGSGYSTAGDKGLVMFASTRNVLIQSGGTFTDAGYRLDVQGTTRITGNTTIGSTGQLFQFSTSANNPSYTQTGATGSSIYTVSGSLQVRMQSFAGGQNWLFATGGRFLTGTSDAQPFEFYTTNLKRVQISANGSMVFYIGTTYDEGANIAIGTTTGTRIGTATNQKIGFWFATPIVQPANTTSLNGVLETTGLMASGSTISTINKPLVAGANTTPRTGTATDGVTSVLGDLKTWNSNYHSGEVLYSEVSGEAINFGQLCYRDRFGKWSKALANVADVTSYNMLGICLHTVGAADTAISILTRGYVETTYISATNTGSPLYMSAATAGSITDTFPAAAGNVVRLVGNVFWDAASQTNGKWILYFNPDSTWIEL